MPGGLFLPTFLNSRIRPDEYSGLFVFMQYLIYYSRLSPGLSGDTVIGFPISGVKAAKEVKNISWEKVTELAWHMGQIIICRENTTAESSAPAADIGIKYNSDKELIKQQRIHFVIKAEVNEKIQSSH